jgi:uncharacterized SAM-binding protein YcdF (DUF218 family)
MNWILFWLKKLLSALILPLGTSLVLLSFGVYFLFRKPTHRTGLGFVLAGLLWLLIMSNPLIAVKLIGSLEKEAGNYAQYEELHAKGIRYIVVLGGDVRTGELSSTDRLATSSLLRVLEGVKLWKNVPGATLVLSGGSIAAHKMSTAEAMANFAMELGVPNTSIKLEAKSWDTDDEARELARLLGKKPFALVTSASHMLRSVMIFRRRGMNPVPAPSDFEARPGAETFFPLPSTGSLFQSSKAIHEYIGITLVLIKNIFNPMKDAHIRDLQLHS